MESKYHFSGTATFDDEISYFFSSSSSQTHFLRRRLTRHSFGKLVGEDRSSLGRYVLYIGGDGIRNSKSCHSTISKYSIGSISIGLDAGSQMYVCVFEFMSVAMFPTGQ